MIITKSDVKNMINQIVGHEDYNTRGHDGEFCEDVDLVKALGQYVKTGPEALFIPSEAIDWLDGSTLGDIVNGIGRPLNYLCSDCRYPKWYLLQGESTYGNPAPIEAGFIDQSNACPRCGD